MIHDARIFPIGAGRTSRVHRPYHGVLCALGRRHVRRRDRQLHGERHRLGATDKLRTLERYRRVADDTLENDVTIDDPTVWSQPWTLMIPLKRTGEHTSEFACHEGNYGMRAILSGARAQERAEAGSR